MRQRFSVEEPRPGGSQNNKDGSPAKFLCRFNSLFPRIHDADRQPEKGIPSKDGLTAV